MKIYISLAVLLLGHFSESANNQCGVPQGTCGMVCQGCTRIRVCPVIGEPLVLNCLNYKFCNTLTTAPFVGCGDVVPIGCEMLTTTMSPVTPTVLPSTTEPSTMQPSSAEPGTQEPSTVEPSTQEPSSVQPSSIVPSTLETPTAEPSTQVPSTIEPLTPEPSTVEPSTEVPPTEVPSTIDPSTQKPPTVEPTPAEPTTQAPSTVQPSSVEPSTQKPAEPTTAIPSTAEPSTPEPSTGEQSTQNPTSPLPSTADPSTLEPSTAQSSTAEPITQEPTTVKSSTEAPSTPEPSTAEPSTKEPSTPQPSTVTPPPVITPSPDTIFCTGTGIYPDPYDCTKYHFCKATNGYSAIQRCPPIYVFNQVWAGSSGSPCIPFMNTPFYCVKLNCTESPSVKRYGASTKYYANCSTNSTTGESKLLIYKCDDGESFNGAECVYTCPNEGLFPKIADPNKYYRCSWFGGQLMNSEESCPPKKLFDVNVKACRTPKVT
ncbi:salivary glue protein Sgs-3-like [Toxorhynchites rutilus septentrionalis]|uniref:salivary glue protein Sgs-3-like n=1 Tax=Toxorhynchites rutilus septentrionalis TaxID=329112 RepID=UPI00247ABE38|nr:salivary glue protein Sgs-3-like [Toxorhynchites rutilus septentrionalis]